MDKQHGKRVANTRRPKGRNTFRFTQSNTQKIPNWKNPGLDGIHGFWFEKFTSIHDRLAIEKKRYQKQIFPKE